MTAKTITALQAEITANILDNSTGLVSPKDVRDAMINTTESLDSGAGWGSYVDSLATPTQSFTSTPSALTVDGLGATSNTDYLPLEIRGVGDLWNTTTNKITPINVGDGYALRVDLKVTSDSTVTDIIVELEIGLASPIVTRYATTGKATPYYVSVSFPFFSLAAFVANGGLINISTNAGTLIVSERSILIHRISNGDW